MRGCKTVETFHEPPLSRPSATLSPPCGERAGRGVPIWFMVPMRAQKRKEAFHEPRIYWKPFLAAGSVAILARRTLGRLGPIILLARTSVPVFSCESSNGSGERSRPGCGSARPRAEPWCGAHPRTAMPTTRASSAAPEAGALPIPTELQRSILVQNVAGHQVCLDDIL